MTKHIRILIIIVVVGVIAGVTALLWPKACTPDVECLDYQNMNNALNSNVNETINTNFNRVP